MGGTLPMDAAIVLLGAQQDTTIFQNSVNNSAGAGPGIFVGTNGMLSPRRGLIAFDVSSIPPGSLITDVQLTLTLGQVAGDNGTGTGGNDVPRVIQLNKLTRSWGEGNTGSTAAAIGTTGGGFPAGPGDATWNAAFYSPTTPTSWASPGGDFVSSPSVSATLSGTIVGTAYTWPSTPALVADVQGWLDQPNTNFGWEIINADETSERTFYAFYSSEWSDRANGDPILEVLYAAQEPELRVTFLVPEPAGGTLLLGAALLLFTRRQDRWGKLG